MTATWIVTVAHGRHDHLANQLRGLASTDAGTSHVVVAMDDEEITAVVERHRGPRTVHVLEETPHPLGLPLAAARNRGVSHARAAGADLVVLLDVDCISAVGTIGRYERAAARAGRGLLCGPVTYLPEEAPVAQHPQVLHAQRRPHPARPDPPDDTLQRGGDMNLFWSLSVAFTPSTWTRLGGFCEDYVGYGGEDTDLGRIATARGVDLIWVGGADVYHQHHPVSTPPVEHVDDIVRNATLFHSRWGVWPMSGWLEQFSTLGLIEIHETRPGIPGPITRTTTRATRGAGDSRRAE